MSARSDPGLDAGSQGARGIPHAHATHLSGYLRVGAAIPPVRVTDVTGNRDATLHLWRQAHDAGVHAVWFPELGLASYSAGDLHLDLRLGQAVDEALAWLCVASVDLSPVAFVGAPVWRHPGVYNCAVAIHRGRILGVVPKSYLPNYGEFYEQRQFRAGRFVYPGGMVDIAGQSAPFGTDLLFEGVTSASTGPGVPSVSPVLIGVEVCEDAWVAISPASRQASAGALVIGNMSGSPFSLGKGEARRHVCWKQSAPNKCGYVYTAAGPGESSSDLAFDAHALIYENGKALAESVRFARTPQLLVSDIDLDALRRDRARTGTFGDNAIDVSGQVEPSGQGHAGRVGSFRHVRFAMPVDGVALPLKRAVDPYPFVPADPVTRATRCWEVFEIQTNALMTRMRHFGNDRLVLALSGGRDSTLAALACANALDQMGLPRTNLTCVSMPGWGTSVQTRTAGHDLALALGASFAEEPIGPECFHILQAQGHPAILAYAAWIGKREGTDLQGSDPQADEFVVFLGANADLADVELENVQARVRKLRVLTRANRERAIEVGTGDLSEKALGWSTYAGDQTGLYDVNCGVPKTLVSAVIRWVADERVATWSAGDPEALRQALDRVLEAPITPELVPTGADGRIVQLTEETIGPFALHDFFLNAFVGDGARPSRIFALGQIAFSGTYPPETIRKWLRVFIRRFFGAQWKRDATPDGPKVLSIALSPRGDWRMPSDAVANAWLADLDQAPILAL